LYPLVILAIGVVHHDFWVLLNHIELFIAWAKRCGLGSA
jgi:hypothetical protein